ncbi:MAG: hypothetical protein ACRDD2_02540 [Sarcina sp.]
MLSKERIIILIAAFIGLVLSILSYIFYEKNIIISGAIFILAILIADKINRKKKKN